MPPEPQLARQVSSRWTPALVRDGFVPVADYFLANYSRLAPPITHSEAMFLIHVFRYKWDAAAPFPSFKAIASMMGVSVQSARAYARSLEQKKYLTREMRVGATNRFHFHLLFAALETLQKADEANHAKPELHTPALPHTIAAES